MKGKIGNKRKNKRGGDIDGQGEKNAENEGRKAVREKINRGEK